MNAPKVFYVRPFKREGYSSKKSPWKSAVDSAVRAAKQDKFSPPQACLKLLLLKRHSNTTAIMQGTPNCCYRACGNKPVPGRTCADLNYNKKPCGYSVYSDAERTAKNLPGKPGEEYQKITGFMVKPDNKPYFGGCAFPLFHPHPLLL